MATPPVLALIQHGRTDNLKRAEPGEERVQWMKARLWTKGSGMTHRHQQSLKPLTKGLLPFSH
jgi:hypothetical protein